MSSKVKHQTRDSLMALVETHDVAGLLNALDTQHGPAFSLPLCPQSSAKYSTREFLARNKSAVERACELGHLDILNLFLINGCSPNLPTSHGRLIHTVLTILKSQRYLVDNGRALITLKLMLSRNCDVNVKTFDHKSTLMLVCELAEPSILKIILRKCSDWQIVFCDGGRGASPLQMACMKGSSECVRLLLKRSSPVDLNTRYNKLTPLLTTLAVLRHNLNYTGSSDDSTTALSLAQHQLMAIIEMLLQAGADPNIGKAQDPREENASPQFNALCCALDLAEEALSVEADQKDESFRLTSNVLSENLEEDPSIIRQGKLDENNDRIPLEISNGHPGAYYNLSLCDSYRMNKYGASEIEKGYCGSPTVHMVSKINDNLSFETCGSKELNGDISIKDNCKPGEFAQRKSCMMCLGLVRLLVYWGGELPMLNDSDLKGEYFDSRFPHLQGILQELCDIEKRVYAVSERLSKPKSLLDITRKRLRLQAAHCNKLGQLDTLPLPQRLKDYCMFLTC